MEEKNKNEKNLNLKDALVNDSKTICDAYASLISDYVRLGYGYEQAVYKALLDNLVQKGSPESILLDFGMSYIERLRNGEYAADAVNGAYTDNEGVIKLFKENDELKNGKQNS